jgi:hypothetical protein
MGIAQITRMDFIVIIIFNLALHGQRSLAWRLSTVIDINGLLEVLHLLLPNVSGEGQKPAAGFCTFTALLGLLPFVFVSDKFL